MKKNYFRKRICVFALASCISTSMIVPSSIMVAETNSQPQYNDGTYEGTGNGFGGKVTVRVTIENNTITSIEEVSQSETPSYWEQAKTLFSTIVERQTPEVDTISGATKSSDAIKSAVRQALASASSTTENIPDTSIFASGSGTTEDPFLIQTASQFKNFATSVTDSIDYDGYTVRLNGNIDISDSNWEPIGGSSTQFNGTFDGNGYTVNGLTEGTSETPRILDKSNTYMGLFGKLGSSAVIKNLNLSNVNINISYPELLYVGGIAATTTGAGDERYGTRIDGCRVSGNITVQNERGNIWAGGLVGMQFRGAIINSVSDVDISATETTDTSWGKTEDEFWVEVGGISGLNFWGLIANSYTTGNCYAKFDDANDPAASYCAVGGIAGLECGDEMNNYATGNITAGKKTKYIGSLHGLVEGKAQIKNNWYCTTSMIKNENIASKATNTNIMVCKDGDPVTVCDNQGFSPSKAPSIVNSLNKIAQTPTIDLSRYGVSANNLDSWKYSTIQQTAVQIHSGNPIKTIDINNCKISGISDKIYTGKSINQKIKVTYNGNSATFTLTYGNHKDIGTQTLTLKGTGDFSGSKQFRYKILPAQAKIKKAFISDKSLKVTYRKVNGATSYQVAIRKGSGAWKIYSTSSTTKNISRISTTKNYKVKVRAYKNVNGKKYYGNWSKVTFVK